MTGPLALIGGSAELARLALAADRERVAAEAVEVAPGDAATRLALLRERLDRGRPVLLTAPLALDLDDADALVDATSRATAPVGYAEPILVSPVGSAGLARCDGLALRRLDVSWRSSGGDAAVDSARAAALMLAVLGARPAPTRRADGTWADRSTGIDVTVEARVDHPVADWSLQAVSADHVVRLEWAPHPGAELDGTPLVTIAPGADPAEGLLRELGYRALVSGIAGAASGRGGTVVPLGFARRVVAACTIA